MKYIIINIISLHLYISLFYLCQVLIAVMQRHCLQRFQLIISSYRRNYILSIVSFWKAVFRWVASLQDITSLGMQIEEPVWLDWEPGDRANFLTTLPCLHPYPFFILHWPLLIYLACPPKSILAGPLKLPAIQLRQRGTVWYRVKFS